MKKLYAFIAGGMLLLSTSTQAQSPRTVFFEEFTGENCGPCAATNPWLKRFSDLNAQDSFIHLAYQVPIPSAGPIYNIYKTDADARISYYHVNSAPWGQNDGLTYISTWQGSATQPITYLDSLSFGASPAASNLTSVGFNQRRAIPSPCSITITHWFSPNYDSVYAMAIVNTTSTYRSAGAGSLKFRLALTEKQLTFLTPPGNNGETEFYNVVRKMYPTAGGSNMVDSLWSGRADTFKVAALIPSYVRERAQIQFIGWVQDDNTKEVKQSGRSIIQPLNTLVDIIGWGDSVQGINCTNGAPVASYAFVNVKNTGVATITTMNVKVYDGTTLLNTVPWTGSLVAGNVAQINVGPLTLSSGQHNLTCVIGNPNGTNVHTAVYDTVKPVTFVAGTSVAYPYAQDFEGTAFPPTNCYDEGETPAGYGWFPSRAFTSQTGNTYWGAEGTVHGLFYNFYNIQAGEIGNFYLPKVDLTSANKAYMTFWHAYKQFDNGGGSLSNDQVEVQASTDCGATWTSVWSKSGSTLVTAGSGSSTTASYKPTAASQWVRDSIPLTTFAGHNNVWFRFRATSDYGDNCWIDQININKVQGVGIDELANVQMLSVYPTPANDNLSMEIGTMKSANYEISIVNTLGEEVSSVFNGQIQAGNQKMDFNVAGIASGVYNLVVKSGDERSVRRFVVAH